MDQPDNTKPETKKVRFWRRKWIIDRDIIARKDVVRQTSYYASKELFDSTYENYKKSHEWEYLDILDHVPKVKNKEGTMTVSRRFDYIRYDEKSAKAQKSAKNICSMLEGFIDALPKGRASSLALTKLEEVYMWIGKAIRDDQIERGVMVDDVPERTAE